MNRPIDPEQMAAILAAAQQECPQSPEINWAPIIKTWQERRHWWAGVFRDSPKGQVRVKSEKGRSILQALGKLAASMEAGIRLLEQTREKCSPDNTKLLDTLAACGTQWTKALAAVRAAEAETRQKHQDKRAGHGKAGESQ